VIECGEGFEITATLAQGDLGVSAAAPRTLRASLAGRTGVLEIAGETCGGAKIRVFQRT
ncbi:MAG: hypothetical protein RLZZ522_2149, partial [Verrucomicrobiota bacterium]